MRSESRVERYEPGVLETAFLRLAQWRANGHRDNDIVWGWKMRR